MVVNLVVFSVAIINETVCYTNILSFQVVNLSSHVQLESYEGYSGSLTITLIDWLLRFFYINVANLA